MDSKKKVLKVMHMYPKIHKTAYDLSWPTASNQYRKWSFLPSLYIISHAQYYAAEALLSGTVPENMVHLD